MLPPLALRPKATDARVPGGHDRVEASGTGEEDTTQTGRSRVVINWGKCGDVVICLNDVLLPIRARMVFTSDRNEGFAGQYLGLGRYPNDHGV